tara:strand:+ start:272 stop:907 length:636 start_codon:yes stop_codon:yes gene_type:complete
MISQKLSIYIPHVFANITKERIVDVFSKQSIGEVERIDFVPKKGKDGREYHMAFIHMKSWYDNDCVSNLQSRILDKTTDARIVYDDPWYWNLYENVNPRSASELKMEEQIHLLNKTVSTQSDRIDKMDAFTQYLEDELNQAQATIARLQDELNHRTPTSSSPIQDQGPPLMGREVTRVPSGVSADIADELHRLQSSSLPPPLKLEDLDEEA